MVLAILKGHVAKRLKQLSDRGVLFLQADWRARKPDLGQSCANRALPGNKRRATCRAALLPIVVGEYSALFRQLVDVGRPVSHHAAVVGADVPVANVIAEDDENVWPLLLSIELQRCDEHPQINNPGYTSFFHSHSFKISAL